MGSHVSQNESIAGFGGKIGKRKHGRRVLIRNENDLHKSWSEIEVRLVESVLKSIYCCHVAWVCGKADLAHTHTHTPLETTFIPFDWHSMETCVSHIMCLRLSNAYPSVFAGPCLVLYSSSSRGIVKNFFIETPFSSNNFTKSIRSCSSACIIAPSSAPCGHSCPYTKISLRAMSTRFQVNAKLNCSGGDRCCDLNNAVNIVWSNSWISPSGFSCIR